ncbi:MAG: LacI family transcriptional regulator [Christensenellaceae bacterium]|nr:LacI family transcriptional regulator [Christensenellaceae bacterium]
MNNNKRVGIRDVAKAANVSITTISKALNDYPDVSPKTRKKVKALAKKMGYVPNSYARYMGGIRKKTVALMMSDFKKEDPSGFVFGVLSGLYASCTQNDHSFILLATSLNKQKESSIIEVCRQNNVDALVTMGFRVDDLYVKQMKEIDIPVTMIDMEIEGVKANSIYIDNSLAAYDVVKYLISKGRKNIAMINGSKNAYVSVERYSGYAKALLDAGFSLNKNYIKYCNFDESIAYQNTKDLINDNPEIDAIFCASDLMAIGTCKAINDLGFKVGSDILVFGFDDIPVSQCLFNGISTVKQNPYDMGFEAGKSVNKQLLEPDAKKERIVVPHSLIFRCTA